MKLSNLISFKQYLLRLNQKGQSILEVAVSLGLITVIITVLTITTLNGLKNSQFAKNQVLASSFAQQGLELAKSMRQRDCSITIAQGFFPGTYYWYDRSKGPLIWEGNNPIPEDPVQNNFSFVADSVACDISQSASTTNGEFLNGGFTRKIKLERLTSNPNIIRVTVDVFWSDFSGEHTAQNVNLLTNY
jgi:hypothetical protein